MKVYSRITQVIICCLIIFLSASSRGAITGGRAIEEGNTASLSLKLGQISSIDGIVRETKRAEDTDETATVNIDEYDQYLEQYNLAELGLDDSYTSLGIQYEKQWTLFTFQLDLAYSEVSGNGTAVREPFAIGVDDISYNGQTYEYMLIEQGRSYTADGDVLTLSSRLLFTPLHIDLKAVQFSPWVHVGLFGMGASYEIDAGPAYGVTTYEYHPYPYVLGGKGTAQGGLIVPEYGFGGELKFQLSKRKGRPMQLVVQGYYAMLNWSGNSGDVGFDARNDKEVDLDYTSSEIRAMLEIPISKGTDLIVGLETRSIDANADIESEHKDPETQEVLREKYDKYVELELTTFHALLGLRF